MRQATSQSVAIPNSSSDFDGSSLSEFFSALCVPDSPAKRNPSMENLEGYITLSTYGPGGIEEDEEEEWKSQIAATFTQGANSPVSAAVARGRDSEIFDLNVRSTSPANTRLISPRRLNKEIYPSSDRFKFRARYNRKIGNRLNAVCVAATLL